MTAKIEKIPISNISHSSDYKFTAFNINNIFYVYDNTNDKLVDLEKTQQHTAIIRSIEFSKDNKFVITASSDKSIKLWDTTNFKNYKTLNVNKKIICSKLNKDDSEILVSDKCGDVFRFSLIDDSKNNITESNDKSTKHDDRENDKNLSFGHYSSIVDIKFSSCFNYLFSADRDEKIRVSHYPNCFDIERFCLSHSKYVTEVVVVSNKPELLVSGSGDGTIKLWNWREGKVLQTISFNDKKENAITIPQFYNESTNQLFLSVEDTPVVYALTLDTDRLKFYEDTIKSVTLEAPVVSIDLVKESVLLVSLLATTKDIKLVNAVDLKSLQQVDIPLVTVINSIEQPITLKPAELKQVIENIEKKQYRKHVSYSKNPNAGNKKGGEGEGDDDLSLDEEDLDDKPLKLRKMTIEGAKEINKELEEKQKEKQSN